MFFLEGLTNLIYPLREVNIKSAIELETVYKIISNSSNQHTLVFYKDILEITLDNRTFKSLHEFKILANKAIFFGFEKDSESFL